MHILKGKSLVITLAVFVLLIFLHSVNVFDPVENFMFKIFSPVQKYFYNSGVKTRIFIENITEKAKQNETELLRAQIRGLLIQNAKLKILAEENTILKKEMGFKQSHPYTLVGARIIGISSPQNSNLRILQIDDEKYTPADLKIGMPIIIEDGILVGKIAEIKQNQIFMMPTTDSRSAIAAAILNDGNTIGVAEGELNTGIKIRLIPQTEKIKQGDLVITSGLEEEMPKGLLLGTVSKVARDPQSPFNMAHVSPLDDLKKISEVLIIKKY